MLNKNFHHIVLLPLSAFVVFFVAALLITPNKNAIAPPPCATFCSEHCDGECTVCKCDIADEHYVLPCGHKFCKECIDNWAEVCDKEITEDVKVEVTFPKIDIDAACAFYNVRIEDAVEGARYIEKRKEYSSNNMVYVYEVTEQKITKHRHQPDCPECRKEFSLPNNH